MNIKVIQIKFPECTCRNKFDFEQKECNSFIALDDDSKSWFYVVQWFTFQPISYSSPRGGISQITEKGDTTASFLLVQQAHVTDSGDYACHSSVGKIAKVNVHVIRSKESS